MSDQQRPKDDSPWDEAQRAAVQAQRILGRVVQEVAQELGIKAPLEERFPFGTAPVAEVTEDETAVYVALDLPGVKSADLEVNLIGGDRLVVEGTRKRPEGEAASVRRSELPYGPFRREIKLPSAVREEGIAASLADGVLNVTLQKAERRKTVKVNVV